MMTDIYSWWSQKKRIPHHVLKKQIKQLVESYKKWDSIKEKAKKYQEKEAGFAEKMLEKSLDDL